MNTACNGVGSASVVDRAAYKAIKFPLVLSHCSLFLNADSLYSSNYLSIFEMAFLHPNDELTLLKRKSDNDIGRDLRKREKLLEGRDEMRMLRVSK